MGGGYYRFTPYFYREYGALHLVSILLVQSTLPSVEHIKQNKKRCRAPCHFILLFIFDFACRPYYSFFSFNSRVKQK
ncbi:MAG: hypothetical protein A2281_12345 [Bacteroidetes bacterium RIFOXYA12_FULL_38_20]|nr:MAG: hypothetical protein A2281_12345 [Bacteroidetes bacterium RIFOXYA12_FULL_38_20]